MISLDTNVLVRLLTNDDTRQVAEARRLCQADQLHVAVTVWLETAWVLRHSYGYNAVQIARGFTALLGLPNLDTPESSAVLRAVTAMRDGADFADALHVALSPAGGQFASFDKALIAKAAQLGYPVRAPADCDLTS